MTPLIAGNWKMNRGPTQVRDFFVEFETARTDLTSGVRIIVFPPTISLSAAADAIGDRVPTVPIALGVQNIHWEPSGAYTGEVSAEMAQEAGASYALVGHSERRHVFGETDRETAAKVGAARRAGLIPVLCIGETADERDAGRLEEVLFRQLDAVLTHTELASRGALHIAYEPVWAIGTGRTATPADASGAHALIRRRLGESLDSFEGDVPILYGGSVKPENAGELLAVPEVGGVLVGGASLDARSFAKIAACAS